MAGFDFVNGNIGSSDESSADGIIFFDSENDVGDQVGAVYSEGFRPLGPGIWLVFYQPGPRHPRLFEVHRCIQFGPNNLRTRDIIISWSQRQLK